MDLLRTGFKLIAYMLVILDVAAAAVIPYSLDGFLFFLPIWQVSVVILLVIVMAFFVGRKIAEMSDERKPKSILELVPPRSLATAGSENLSDVVPSFPEMWLDFIWKPTPSHAKGVADDYLAPLLEETESPTPYDVLPPWPPSPPPADASYDAPSAPAYHAADDDVPPSPPHTWQDVPSCPAPYSPNFYDVPPSPAAYSWHDVPSSPAPYSPNFYDVPPSPAAYSWHDVPSSPAPYSPNLYDVPPSPAAYSWHDVPSPPAPYSPNLYDVPPSPAAYSWHDVPSSPAPYSPDFYDVPPSPAAYSWHDVPSSPAYDYLYDHVPSSPANAAAMFSSCRSPYEAEPELFQSEVEKNVVYNPLLDHYWNDVPSARLTATATSANFSCSRRFTSTFENEPWQPEVRKEMMHPCHDDNKSIDETWNSIADGGRSLAKSLRRQHRHQERGQAPAAKKGPKRAEITSNKEVVAASVKNDEHKKKNEEERYPTAATRKGPKRAEITSSKEVVAAATRKEPQKAEIASSKEVAAVGKKVLKKTKTLKKETGWRDRAVLEVSKEEQDELFQRAETLIKKHYDNLRLQRQQSARRRFLEKLRWTS